MHDFFANVFTFLFTLTKRVLGLGRRSSKQQPVILNKRNKITFAMAPLQLLSTFILLVGAPRGQQRGCRHFRGICTIKNQNATFKIEILMTIRHNQMISTIPKIGCHIFPLLPSIPHFWKETSGAQMSKLKWWMMTQKGLEGDKSSPNLCERDKMRKFSPFPSIDSKSLNNLKLLWVVRGSPKPKVINKLDLYSVRMITAKVMTCKERNHF